MPDRRAVLKWIMAAACSAPMQVLSASARDPDLLKAYSPGDLWPLTLDAETRETAAALCDVIIPQDAQSPGASAVGVVDFIDEWISAPYPRHRDDRTMILSGFGWLDSEASGRFAAPFRRLDSEQQRAICDDICYVPRAQPAVADAALFFARFRDLTIGAFYTTPAGRADLHYIGNVPLERFDGPPPEVLEAAGLLVIERSRSVLQRQHADHTDRGPDAHVDRDGVR